MGFKYTKIKSDTFQNLQINSGIILTTFTPASPTVTDSNILFSTTGGLNVSAIPSFKDMGEDVDNCPKNTKQLKNIDSWEVTMSGTAVTVSTAVCKSLLAAADIDTTDTTKVVPRTNLLSTDFADLWFVGDYSDKNGATNGGFVAIKIKNALSTGGFVIQTEDKNKGKFAFTYTGHSDLSSPDTVPIELYIKAGTAEPTTNNTPVVNGDE